MAPSRLKIMLDRRQNGMPFFGLTRRELEAILGASRFSDFTVTSEVCQSPLWRGRHLECIAGSLPRPAEAGATGAPQAIPSSKRAWADI